MRGTKLVYHLGSLRKGPEKKRHKQTTNDKQHEKCLWNGKINKEWLIFTYDLR